jgi:hypothetical protein
MLRNCFRFRGIADMAGPVAGTTRSRMDPEPILQTTPDECHRRLMSCQKSRIGVAAHRRCLSKSMARPRRCILASHGSPRRIDFVFKGY